VFISDFIFHTLKIITKSESHLLWSWVHSSSKIYIHTSVLKSTNIGRHLICNRYAANKAHMLQFDIVTTALINHHQNNTNQSDSLPECCNYFEVCKLRLHSLFRLYNFDEKVRNWCRITLTIFKQPQTYYVTDIPVINYKKTVEWPINAVSPNHCNLQICINQHSGSSFCYTRTSYIHIHYILQTGVN